MSNKQNEDSEFDSETAMVRLNISDDELYSMVKRRNPEIAEAILKEVE